MKIDAVEEIKAIIKRKTASPCISKKKNTKAATNDTQKMILAVLYFLKAISFTLSLSDVFL